MHHVHYLIWKVKVTSHEPERQPDSGMVYASNRLADVQTRVSQQQASLSRTGGGKRGVWRCQPPLCIDMQPKEQSSRKLQSRPSDMGCVAACQSRFVWTVQNALGGKGHFLVFPSEGGPLSVIGCSHQSITMAMSLRSINI